MLKRSRLVVLLSLLVFTSGWIRLPMPSSWLVEEVELQGLKLKLTADSAKFSWALGRVELNDVRLRLNGQEVLLAPQTKMHLGQMPFTPGFGKPWLVELQGPQIELDEELLRRLPTLEDRGAQELPELAFLVTGGRLVWRTAGNSVLAWKVERLHGKLSQMRSDVHLEGRMLEPVQSAVRAKASAELDNWWFQLEGENSRAEDAWRPQDIEALRGIEVRPGQYSFRLAAHQAPGQALQSELQLSLQNASAEITEPPLHLSQIQLHASGGLREGVRTELRALVDEDFHVLSQGRMQWPEEGGAWLTMRGDSTAVLVDQNRLDWLRLLHPVTAEILEALEVRGGPEARFALDWRQGEKLGWAVHADTSGMHMRYRGIATSTGEKPAFPYPVQAESGDFVAAGRWLLMDVRGKAGAGTMEGRGVVEVRTDDSGVYLDIAGRDIAINREIRAAATGTPQIAELWRQLGIPQGGTGDVDLRIRANHAREHIGITIGGVARGVQMRPKEMPIPLLIDEVEYFWTAGYSSFDAHGQSPGGPVQVYGEIRDCEGEEYPGIRAVLNVSNPAPDLRTRRTLVERLQLPSWLSQFSPSGDSSLKLEYHQAPTSEAAQYLLDVRGRAMQMNWGTALGNVFVPFIGVQQLTGDFQLAGSEDTHAFVAPQLDAKFSGRAVQVNLDSLSDDTAGITATSEGIQLPAAVVTAIVHLLQIDEILGPLQIDVTSDLLLEWRNERENPLAAKLKFDPLRLLLPDSTDPLELYGEILVSEGRLEAPSFRLEQGSGWIEVDDLVFYFGADRQELSAVVDSAHGIRLSREILQLLGPNVVTSLTALGLEGGIGPRSVEVHYIKEEGNPARLQLLQGEVLLSNFRADGPPGIREGSARITIESFDWREETGVEAELRIQDGRAVVADVPIRNAQGMVVVHPDKISFEGVRADALGGWMRVREQQQNGTGPGHLLIGLTPKVPIEAQIEFGDLQLAQLQRQLNLDAGARGVLRGWAEIDSNSLAVLDYRGRGRLDIEEGRLTTVPVLEQIWGLLGVDPPIFRESTVKFRMDGDARVRIEELQLRHDLLNVEGKGWIYFDGFVQLKVTLRRVMLLLGLPVTDLPLLSQFLDLFVEQEIFGPIDRLQLAPRSVRKILGRELPKVPKPLWIPSPERRPSGSSPIFPLHEDPDRG
ncbi:MAG: hypothetical protein MK209_03550 [Planctomycetes bacterium]|nr:hypothetical protein [Planctomycetota bacterium]